MVSFVWLLICAAVGLFAGYALHAVLATGSQADDEAGVNTAGGDRDEKQ